MVKVPRHKRLTRKKNWRRAREARSAKKQEENSINVDESRAPTSDTPISLTDQDREAESSAGAGKEAVSLPLSPLIATLKRHIRRSNPVPKAVAAKLINPKEVN